MTVVLAALAGALPGLLALFVQWRKNRAERPLKDANAAKVLADTSVGLVEKMEHQLNEMRDELDATKAELRRAENEISALRARLDEAVKHAETLGAERERRRLLEAEIAQLREQLGGRRTEDDTDWAAVDPDAYDTGGS